VAGGAGIGRLRKDRLLRRLLDELRVPWRRFRHRVEYRGVPGWEGWPPSRRRGRLAGARPWLRSALARLRRVGPRRGETFGAFVRRALGGEPSTRRFRALLGFGDDWEADAADTLRGYGFDDNFALGWGMSVPWNRLVDAMVREIRRRGGRVVTGCRVQGLEMRGPRGGWLVRCGRGARCRPLHADAVLLAVPASQMRRLVGGAPGGRRAAGLLAGVRAQSFLYAYARARKPAQAAAASLPQTYTVLAGSPLQKVIPMGGGVFMVAYADNARARQLRREGCAGVLRRAETALGVRFAGCMLRWIGEGTHYFAPLPARFPSRARFLAALRGSLPPGLFVAGEALSEGNQGWVEGALRDAEAETGRLAAALRC
jgi:hypothetical protein